MTYHGYVQVQGRGVVSLPVELRRRLNIDAAGAQLEITEREDGVIELRPMVAVPADQAWFWTEEWQAGERQVDEDIDAGRNERFDSAADFAAALQDMIDESE